MAKVTVSRQFIFSAEVTKYIGLLAIFFYCKWIGTIKQLKPNNNMDTSIKTTWFMHIVLDFYPNKKLNVRFVSFATSSQLVIEEKESMMKHGQIINIISLKTER